MYVCKRKRNARVGGQWEALAVAQNDDISHTSKQRINTPAVAE